MTGTTSWVLGAWTALVLLTSLGAAVDERRAQADHAVVAPGRAAPPSTPSAVSPPVAQAVPGTDPAPVPAAAVAVEATGVGIGAPLVSVGKTPDGALAVPDFGTAGWYRYSAVPGAPGAAVLAGHVDSWTGPDVFHTLGELRRGDEVVVVHADGSRSTFQVHDHEVVGKDALPIERIFDAPVTSELRLITCGGPFDHRTRSYESNVVVWAHLTSRSAAPAEVDPW